MLTVHVLQNGRWLIERMKLEMFEAQCSSAAELAARDSARRALTFRSSLRSPRTMGRGPIAQASVEIIRLIGKAIVGGGDSRTVHRAVGYVG
jgi:hypothetical protein